MVYALESVVKEPFIYVRRDIPVEYVEKLRALGAKVVVENWEWNQLEPKPQVDLTDCDVILTLGIRDDLSILSHAPHVKWVHSFSVGIEAMLKSKFQHSDVIVTNSKGCTAIPIAEHTIAMILTFARGIPSMIYNKPTRVWGLIPTIELSSSTLAIIGYGEIGIAIAKRAKALGMNVIGCKRSPHKLTGGEDYADQIVGMDKIDEVLAEADFTVLALPSTNETKYFFDKTRMDKMKKGSYLINVGRGNTIVEADLITVLKNKHLAGASLDVFEVEPLPPEHYFWEMDNVIVSPHNAYYSPDHMKHNMQLFIDNFELYIKNKPLKNIVDKQLGY